MRKKSIPPKEELKKLMDELGSMGKVASEIGRPYGTVRAWFNKYKLERPKNCRHIYHELRNTPMSNVHKSVLIGSVLGDGGLVIPRRSKNAKLYIKHCTKQKPYLNWKKKMLDPFSRPIYQSSEPGDVVINGVSTVSTGSFTCYTIAHPDITEMYDKYYVKGQKRVSGDVIDRLDLLGLSIWLADDGSFYSDKKCTNVLGGKVCTNSFHYEEQKILKKALSKFFAGHIGIIPVKGRDEFMLKLTGSKEVGHLLEMVRNVLPKAIHYKLDPQRLHVKLPR